MTPKNSDNIPKKILFMVNLFTRGFIMLSVGLTAAIICLQVFCRFVLNHPLTWPEEVSVILIMWSTLIAAVYVQLEKGHIRVDYFANKLNKNSQFILETVLNMLIIVFLVVLEVVGITLVSAMKVMPLQSLGISRAVPYLCIPVFGITFLGALIYTMAMDFRERRKG